MNGWLLIVCLLLLGGVLSTLGDRLGSHVGKSRLSIFNLRPKRTAILITVLTGSIISSLSFGFMLLVNKQLRVGLFELTQLQKERVLLEEQIKSGAQELKQLQKDLIALRRGDVVISTGQVLASSTIQSEGFNQSKLMIERLLQEANLDAFRLVKPGERPNRQIILIPRSDIKRLENIVNQKGTWAVNIRSAANVLRGEDYVYAFPEVRPNKKIVLKGQVLAVTTIQKNERSLLDINKRINLLLASTLSEVKRRGSLSQGLDFNVTYINALSKALIARKEGVIKLESVALRTSETSDKISVSIRVQGDSLNQLYE